MEGAAPSTGASSGDQLIRGSVLGESPRARDTAALGSIHTVDVYDFGVTTEEGDFYYVMELLEALGLERLVREFGPVDPVRTVGLLRQVCHSLGEAHGGGVVHRDIKPAKEEHRFAGCRSPRSPACLKDVSEARGA